MDQPDEWDFKFNNEVDSVDSQRPLSTLSRTEMSAVREAATSWARSNFSDMGPGQIHHIVGETLKVAHEHALSSNATAGQYQDDIVPNAINVIIEIRSGLDQLSESKSDEDFWRDPPGSLWRHKDSLFQDAKEGRVPIIDRATVERAAGQYLELPFRIQPLERAIVDLLIAMEIYAYVDEALGDTAKIAAKNWSKFPPPGNYLHPTSVHSKHPYRRGIGVGIALGFLLLAVSVGVWFVPTGFLSELTIFWVGLVTAPLGLTLLLFGIRDRKVVSRLERERDAGVCSLIKSMSRVYNALRGDGPVSAARLRELVVQADNDGAQWPAPLYALLDDNLRRQGWL